VSAFIDAHRSDFGVELICRTIGTSASAYHERAGGQRSVRAVEDDRLLGVIRRVHSENYEASGSRRMWKAVLREGEQVGRGRVERLMSRNGHRRRQAPRQAVANHHRRRRSGQHADICAPGPTHPAPTARSSATNTPCSASGPTPWNTPQAKPVAPRRYVWVRRYDERRTHTALGNRPPLDRVRQVTGLDS